MSSMYSVSPVCRTFDPQDMDLPKSMYQMKYSYQTYDTSSNGSTDSRRGDLEQDLEAADLVALKRILESQEKLLNQLDRLEHRVVQLTGGQTNGCTRSSCGAPRGSTLSFKSWRPVRSRDPSIDLCIHCDVDSPPLGLQQFLSFARETLGLKILSRTHYHSSVSGKGAKRWQDLRLESALNRNQYDLTLTFILKPMVPMGCYLMLSPVSGQKIWGEVNILRFMVRLIGFTDLYPEDNVREALEMDSLLDMMALTSGLISSGRAPEATSGLKELKGRMSGASGLYSDCGLPGISSFALLSIVKSMGSLCSLP